MTPHAARLAVHDAICANGGVKCSDRDGHARRNINDTEAERLVKNLEDTA